MRICRQKSKIRRQKKLKNGFQGRTFASQKNTWQKNQNLKKTLKKHIFSNFTLQNTTLSTEFLAAKKEKKITPWYNVSKSK